MQSFQSAFSTFNSGIDQLVTGAMKGTEKISDLFKQMGINIAKSLVESGVKDLLVGSSAAPAQGQSQNFFNTGGLAGQFSTIFGQAFQQASGVIGSALGSVFSTAFQGISGTLSSLFSSAFQGSQGTLDSLFSSAFGAISGVGGGSSGFEGLLGPLATLGVGFFEKGGVVPSAARGMIAGGGLALLHPNEMVLPSKHSDVIQNLADERSASRGAKPGEGGNGGHTFNINYAVHSPDAQSFKQLLNQHGNILAGVIKNQLAKGAQYRK